MNILACLRVLTYNSTKVGIVVTNWDESSLVSEVKEKQEQDSNLLVFNANVHNQEVSTFEQRGDKYQGRFFVPRVDGLQDRIMEESHKSRYSIHTCSTKMYHDFTEVFLWEVMRKDIAEFVAKCLNCQKVKVQHQRPGGLAQNIELPVWKWDMINMNFIIVLPRSRRLHGSIYVIVDKLTKFGHFLAVKTTHSIEDYSM